MYENQSINLKKTKLWSFSASCKTASFAHVVLQGQRLAVRYRCQWSHSAQETANIL